MSDKRRAPFCWQSVDALAAIRHRFDGRRETDGKKLSRVIALGIYSSLTEIANERRDRDGFDVSYNDLAARCGASRPTVIMYSAVLADAGVIAVVDQKRSDGGSGRNKYTLLDPDPPVNSVDPPGKPSSETGKPDLPPPVNVVYPKTQEVKAQEEEVVCSARVRAGVLPADFPSELLPNLRETFKLLTSMAKDHNALEVKPMPLAHVFMSRPNKHFVKSAHDCVSFYDGKHVRDVVATYRNWLDRNPDMAQIEQLDENGRPKAALFAVPNGSRAGYVSAKVLHEQQLEDSRRRGREALARIQAKALQEQMGGVA